MKVYVLEISAGTTSPPLAAPRQPAASAPQNADEKFGRLHRSAAPQPHRGAQYHNIMLSEL